MVPGADKAAVQEIAAVLQTFEPIVCRRLRIG